MAILVRAPKAEDMDDIFAVGLAMHAESIYKDFDYDRKKVGFLLEAAVGNRDFFGRVFVNSNNDKIVGYAMMMITEHFFGYSRYVLDLGVYVIPPLRGEAGMAVIKTIKQVEKWAADNDCVEIVLGVSAGITDKKSIELYNRLGYRKTDQALHKKVHS